MHKINRASLQSLPQFCLFILAWKQFLYMEDLYPYYFKELQRACNAWYTSLKGMKLTHTKKVSDSELPSQIQNTKYRYQKGRCSRRAVAWHRTESEAVLHTTGSLLMWFKALAIFLNMNRTGLTASSGTLWQRGFIQVQSCPCQELTDPCSLSHI